MSQQSSGAQPLCMPTNSNTDLCDFASVFPQQNAKDIGHQSCLGVTMILSMPSHQSYSCCPASKVIQYACHPSCGSHPARKQKDEDILNDKAKGGDYTTTNTLLDPYGKEPSKYPTKS